MSHFYFGWGKWTDGLGCIPCEFTDDLASKNFDLDIEAADYTEGVDCSLFSMGKRIRTGWKFEFELSGRMGWSPSGHIVVCCLGDDNVIRIPHMVRTGKETAEFPVPEGDYSIGSVSNACESATGNWPRGLFNHSNSKQMWRALGVTSGYKQPVNPFQECLCISCATPNAASKGPKHTQCHMLMIGSCNVGTAHYLLGGSISSTASDSDETEPIWFNAKADDSEDSDYATDPAHPSELDNPWEATVRGRSTESKLPRFDIEKLRPWEAMFTDGNEFDTYQRGGTNLVSYFYSQKRDGWFFRNEFSKAQHEESCRRITIENGVQTTP